MKRLRFAFLVFVLCCVPPGAAHAATFRGKVLAPDGKPVAGAALWIGAAGLLAYSEKDGTLRRLTTGDDGTFAVDFPEAPAEATAFVRVVAEGFAILHRSE